MGESGVTEYRRFDPACYHQSIRDVDDNFGQIQLRTTYRIRYNGKSSRQGSNEVSGPRQDDIEAMTDATRSVKGKAKAVERPTKTLKRTRQPSTSSSNASDDDANLLSGSGSGSDDGGDQAAMLAALQAHSRSLLGIDGPEQAESSLQAQRRLSQSSDDEDDDDDEGDHEGDNNNLGDEDGAEMEEFQSDDGWGAEDGFVSDSEDGLEEITKPTPVRAKEKETALVGKGSETIRVPEVVFAPRTSNNSDVLSKAERRAFLVCVPLNPLYIIHCRLYRADLRLARDIK